MLRAGFGCGCYSDVRAGRLGAKRGAIWVAIRGAKRGAIPDHAISINRQAAHEPRCGGVRHATACHTTVWHANVWHANQGKPEKSKWGRRD